MPDKPITSPQFYNRPSLGLKLWGPLVPAADNRTGLWTLWSIQTVLGIYALYRFRKLSIKPPQPSPLTSTTTTYHGLPASLNRFANQPTISQTKTLKWRRGIALIIGVGILSQSSLEWCRLKLLPYDPWLDEARIMRDKKFFNDIIKFYYNDDQSSTDSIKIVKVESTTPSSSSSTHTSNEESNSTSNIPSNPHHVHKRLTAMEWRQSIAIIRAQKEQNNPVIKWFGPIEYQPMSFGKYLDALEYYLSMKEIWQANDTILIRPSLKEDYQTLCNKNNSWRNQIIKGQILLSKSRNVNMEPPLTASTNATTTSEAENSSRIHNRNITIDPMMESKDTIDLNEIWTLQDPWMNLALDTSLSIKFIPTSITRDKSE